MENTLISLSNSLIFTDIPEESVEKLCGCLQAVEKNYDSDAFVFREDDAVRYVYFILSGSFHIITEDFWGNRSIIETMNEGTLFGEAYLFSGRKEYIVSVVAASDSVLLQIEPQKMFESCPNSCECHSRFTKNILALISEKIVRLTEKSGHIMQRTTQEKLLSYLSKCAKIEKSNSFLIPYSRQQLADYLCVERSALSHELSKLQRLGMIQYRKNSFELLTRDR